MGTTVVVYGASDDLIEVEGTARGCDEYGGGDKPRRVVMLPSGDVFRVEYGADGRGVWSIEHEVRSGQLSVAIERAPEGDDPEPYTDKLTASGVIERVEVCESWPMQLSELRDRVQIAFDNGVPKSWDAARLRRILDAVSE